jgi:hypothetical protein
METHYHVELLGYELGLVHKDNCPHIYLPLPQKPQRATSDFINRNLQYETWTTASKVRGMNLNIATHGNFWREDEDAPLGITINPTFVPGVFHNIFLSSISIFDERPIIYAGYVYPYDPETLDIYVKAFSLLENGNVRPYSIDGINRRQENRNAQIALHLYADHYGLDPRANSVQYAESPLDFIWGHVPT